MTLRHVLYVPGMFASLLSAAQVNAAGFKPEQHKGVVEQDGKTILTAEREGLLFKVHAEPVETTGYANVTRALLHRRFGRSGRSAQHNIEVERGATGKVTAVRA